MAQHIFSGSGVPGFIPSKIGQHYIDITNNVPYISCGTALVTDWIKSSTAVNSVFGRSGLVTAQSGDYTAAQVGADPSGSASTAISNHVGASDPHPQYTTNAEVPALAPVQTVNSKTGTVVLDKTDIGLGNVDNTTDDNKPISSATQTALNDKVTKNTAITGATKTKITYDAKGLVTSGTDIAINDVVGFDVTTPNIDDILSWNGANFANKPPSSVSAGTGVNFFLTNTDSDISGYEKMQKIPDNNAEVDESIIITNQTSDFEAYLSELPLGGTQIDAGIWSFNIFRYCSPTTNLAKLFIDVYKRTSSGVENILFTISTKDINDTAVTLETITSVQPIFSINATDRLIFKFRAFTDSLVPVTIHLVHSGTTNYTWVATPLSLRHNDLSTIQGGNGTERYHLTSAEYTGTGSGVFAKTSSPHIITPTGIVKGDVGLENVDNTSDANKPISSATQAALNSKYDSSNPSGYESVSQLNTRDTNNRARANHTGTQLASTISDFASGILSTVLTGYALGSNAVLAAADSILQAFGKIQAQINSKEPTITAGTSAQYWRGDKTWQTHDKASVGLGSVDNTTDSAKTLTGDIGGTLGAAVLGNSGVTAGTYVQPSITVDSKGRITSASNGFIEDAYVMTSTQASTSSTPANVTQLTSISLPVGKYRFECSGMYQSANTNTGIGLRISGVSATIGPCFAKWTISQSAAGTAQDFHYDQLTSTTNTTSASSNTANTNAVFFGVGFFEVTVAGTVAIQLRSETTTAVTLQIGTYLTVEQIA
jgi:hypothetical protein